MSVDILRVVTAGSVDDGKSTLIGRLLMDLGAVREDHYADATRASQRMGRTDTDLALITDGLRAEREQGITIDVAYRYLSTAKRRFILADSPGHLQYTRNMVTAASTADLAILLVDAERGVQTQSKRHLFLASLLRVPHVVVIVNKMDLIGFDESVYHRIVSQLSSFAEKLSLEDLTFIPGSALRGDNITRPSPDMGWYQGPTLVHHLETAHIAASRNMVDFRFAVQLVVRGPQGERGLAGQVSSGGIRRGEKIVVLPSGLQSQIRAITTFDGPKEEARAGDSVVLHLEDELDVGRGDLVLRVRNLPQASSDLECTLCWFDEDPLRLGAEYVLQHTTRRVRATVAELVYRIDVDTLHRAPAETLTKNEIARVRIASGERLFFDPYELNRHTGSFILIDRATHRTVAAGMIRGDVRRVQELTAKNVVWHGGKIDREAWEGRQGHGAAVVWLTGLPSSGKSTIARELEQRLFTRNVRVAVLDGDNVRLGLNSDLGFAERDRQENVRRFGEVARLFFEHGQIVLCALISPYLADREAARKRLPEGRFIEVFVDTDVDACRARDPKGLYARADRGDIAHFTGVSAPYEPSENPELVLKTTEMTPEAAADRILEELVRRGILERGRTDEDRSELGASMPAEGRDAVVLEPHTA